MSKIQLNKNQKEVLFIVALFLVPFLDPGFALLLGLILSLTIGHHSWQSIAESLIYFSKYPLWA